MLRAIHRHLDFHVFREQLPDIPHGPRAFDVHNINGLSFLQIDLGINSLRLEIHWQLNHRHRRILEGGWDTGEITRVLGNGKIAD